MLGVGAVYLLLALVLKYISRNLSETLSFSQLFFVKIKSWDGKATVLASYDIFLSQRGYKAIFISGFQACIL